MLWIFSALCKAAWLIRNALSNTGTYTGIKSHSKTDSDTEHRRTRRGESCCSGDGGRCSFSSSRPIAPPHLPLRCPPGWRGFPPGSERSGSTRRCAEQPAGGETHRELRERVGRPLTSLAQNWGASFEERSYRNQCGGEQWRIEAGASPAHPGLVMP